jgi:hypothetical protein
LRADIQEQMGVRGQRRHAAQGVVGADHVELVDATDLLREVEGLERAGEVVGRIGAAERLDAQEPAGGEIPDRLEERGHLAFFDQLPYAGLLLQGCDDGAFADVVEVRYLIAAAALGLVESGVGLGSQRVRRLSGALGADPHTQL